MTQLAAGTRLVIASHNKGKVKEMADLLRDYRLELISAADLCLPEPEETGASFRENAELKARTAAQHAGLMALSDDSGLAVDALNGAPGIFSARWAPAPHGGMPRDFRQACLRVWENIQKADMDHTGAHYTAQFVCVLALAWPHDKVISFEGRVSGQIVWPPRGEYGFGYDPIFIADGQKQSFGEMKPEDKHKISHRAHAFVLLKNYFEKNYFEI